MTEPLFADPFTYVIQHLNSNPYVLSEAQKPSVIEYIKTLRHEYYNVHRSDCAVHNEPAYPNGPCDCGAAKEPRDYQIQNFTTKWEGGY